MNCNHVEAKVLRHHGNSTNLLIRAGDLVVQANYSEVAPCAFPVWTGAPVHVEIPLHGVRHHVAGVASEAAARENAAGTLPNTVKFPVYSYQVSSTVEAFESLPDPSVRSTDPPDRVPREPLVAVGVSGSGILDARKRVETHWVLPAWTDGTAVLVTLNWYDGELAEGIPNPEWHLRASNGMPLDMGLRSLQKFAQLSGQLTDRHYCLHFSPWKLGASILDSAGQETPHRIWQRAWRFGEFEEFENALGRVCDVLCGLNKAAQPSMAEQQA